MRGGVKFRLLVLAAGDAAGDGGGGRGAQLRMRLPGGDQNPDLETLLEQGNCRMIEAPPEPFI